MTTKLYEVILQGQLAGQTIVNKFNYRSDGDDLDSGNAFGLTQAMGFDPTTGAFPSGTLADHLTAVQQDAMQWQQVIARAVYDPLDFVDIPFVPVVAGQGASGDASPTFVAYGFRTNRVRTDIGRGYRRIAGVGEGQVDPLGALTSGIIAALDTLATDFGSVLSKTEGSNTIHFTPVVVHKHIYTTPSGKKAYRYYNTADGGEAAQLENVAAGITWEVYDHVRSQVSRQIGKGR